MAKLVITPHSAFPLGLKLVDSCSTGCLLFYLHFLVLILVHRVKKKDLAVNLTAWHSFATETKMLASFSSPVGPCGSESSVWSQTFSFLCQSSGKGSYTDGSSAWPTSAVRVRRKQEPAVVKMQLKLNIYSPKCKWSIFLWRSHHKRGWCTCMTNTDLHIVRLHSSLDALRLQSWERWSVVHSVHQLRSCVQVFRQIEWLYCGDTVNFNYNFSSNQIIIKNPQGQGCLFTSWFTAAWFYLPSFLESTKNICLFFCLLPASRRWSSPFSLSIFWKQMIKTQ